MPARRRRQKARGSFLILTTWLLGILTLLALGVSFRSRLALRMTSYAVERTQARFAALAGVERVKELLSQDTTASYDALNEPWASDKTALADQPVMPGRTVFTVSYNAASDAAARAGESAVIYGAQDEQSRLNLNTATVEMLTQLLHDGEVADAMVKYRTGDPAEDAKYEALQPPRKTKGKRFDSFAELTLVRGMNPDESPEALQRFQIARQFCTVYPTEGAPVNLNTAPRDVLMVLGLSPPLVDALLAYRRGNDGLPGTEDDRVFTQAAYDHDQWPVTPVSDDDAARLAWLFQQGLLGVKSSAVRIRSEGRTADGTIRQTVDAVLLRPSAGQPFTTVEWRWE